MRAIASVLPPGANGTMMRTLRPGHSCAAAAPGSASVAATPASAMALRRLITAHSLALMPAALMTGAHFSISALRCAPSASGVEPTGISAC